MTPVGRAVADLDLTYSGGYMYPPRPEIAVPIGSIGMYEQRGWIAQAKKNGTCTLLVVGPDGMVPYDRHGQVQKLWRGPPPAMERRIRSALPPGWSALVGEALHSKVPGIRDTLYLFDVLAVGGRTLTGTRLSERLDALKLMFPGGETTPTHRDLGDGLLVARSFKAGFRPLFDSIIGNPEDEGLVMKDPGATLSNPFKEGSNAGWQAKCRKPTKNYSH